MKTCDLYTRNGRKAIVEQLRYLMLTGSAETLLIKGASEYEDWYVLNDIEEKCLDIEVSVDGHLYGWLHVPYGTCGAIRRYLWPWRPRYPRTGTGADRRC